MRKRKYKKGTYGYLKNLKLKTILFIVFSFLIALLIFGFGYYKTHTKSNIMTVIAILMLLPACKRIVNLIVIFPFKPVDLTVYKKLSEYAIPQTRAYVDVLFSSEKYIMKFDYCIMTEKELFALSSMNKEKTQYSESYLNEAFKKRGVSVKVKVYSQINDYEHLLKVLQNDNEPVEDSWRFFESLMV